MYRSRRISCAAIYLHGRIWRHGREQDYVLRSRFYFNRYFSSNKNRFTSFIVVFILQDNIIYMCS